MIASLVYNKVIRWWMLSCIWISCSGISVVWGQNAYLLDDIQLSATSQYERISLQFQSPPPFAPLIDFDRGLLYIRLSQSALKTPGRTFSFPKTSQLIKHIRTTPNANSVLLEVILQNASLSLEEHVTLSYQGNYWFIDIDPKVADTLPNNIPADVTEEQLNEEIKQRLAVGLSNLATFSGERPPSSTATETAEDLDTFPVTTSIADESTVTLIMVTLFLLLLLMLLYGGVYFYQRWFAGKFPALRGQFPIKVVSTYHLGTKQKVVILEVNQQHFACGVTPTQVNFLTELKQGQDRQFLKQTKLKQGEVVYDPGETRAQFLKTLNVARQQAQKIEEAKKPTPKTPKPPVTKTEAPSSEEDGMKQFSHNLMDKLKQLKPIN